MLTEAELSKMKVGDIMRRWPDTVPIFYRHRLACPGCALANFCTLQEVDVSYEHVQLAALAGELQALIGEAVSAPGAMEDGD